jgi:hypothetical protein
VLSAFQYPNLGKNAPCANQMVSFSPIGKKEGASYERWFEHVNVEHWMILVKSNFMFRLKNISIIHRNKWSVWTFFCNKPGKMVNYEKPLYYIISQFFFLALFSYSHLLKIFLH